MAICKAPLLSEDAKGSVGPLTFYRGSGAHCVRTRTKPCNSRSVLQTENHRLCFAWVEKLWDNQTPSVIQRWVNFADNWSVRNRFGDDHSLSSRLWYLKFNFALARAGLPVITVPPLNPCPSYFPTISILWTVLGAEMSWTPEIPLNNAIIVRQQRVLRAVNLRPKRGSISHIFYTTDSSPQLVTPPSGNGGGPGNQPPFDGGSYIHFHVCAIDNYGRKTVELFFPLYTGF